MRISKRSSELPALFLLKYQAGSLDYFAPAITKGRRYNPLVPVYFRWFKGFRRSPAKTNRIGSKRRRRQAIRMAPSSELGTEAHRQNLTYGGESL